MGQRCKWECGVVLEYRENSILRTKRYFFSHQEHTRLFLFFANFRPGAYSVVLIYISAEPVPGVLISGI